MHMTDTKPKVMIVEDEQSLLKTMQFTLDSAGYEVLIAADGEKALERAREHKPRLMLLDIVLPKMSGMDVLKVMKQEEDLKGIEVVMLTNLSDEKSISEAIGMGARGYFVKSDMSLDDLLSKVKEIVPLK